MDERIKRYLLTALEIMLNGALITGIFGVTIGIMLISYFESAIIGLMFIGTACYVLGYRRMHILMKSKDMVIPSNEKTSDRKKG